MAYVRILDRFDPSHILDELFDPDAITALLGAKDILWEKVATMPPSIDDAQSAIELNQPCVDALSARFSCHHTDIVHVNQHTSRPRVLQEHSHADGEIRLFIEGSATFLFPFDTQIIALTMEAGELIFIPGGQKHGFDMGKAPFYTAIRFFKYASGWQAKYTGDVFVEHYLKAQS